jgi:hypothetical protein
MSYFRRDSLVVASFALFWMGFGVILVNTCHADNELTLNYIGMTTRVALIIRVDFGKDQGYCAVVAFERQQRDYLLTKLNGLNLRRFLDIDFRIKF